MRLVGPVAPAMEQDPAAASMVSGSASPEPVASDAATEQRKQALAADLEDMIGGMLRTTQFAAAATPKPRTRPVEAPAPNPTNEASTLTPNSLVADLAKSQPAPVAAANGPAAPRHRWIDAVLVLACVVSVLSAGYFTLVP